MSPTVQLFLACVGHATLVSCEQTGKLEPAIATCLLKGVHEITGHSIEPYI